jgi:hypothetical protein
MASEERARRKSDPGGRNRRARPPRRVGVHSFQLLRARGRLTPRFCGLEVKRGGVSLKTPGSADGAAPARTRIVLRRLSLFLVARSRSSPPRRSPVPTPPKVRSRSAARSPVAIPLSPTLTTGPPGVLAVSSLSLHRCLGPSTIKSTGSRTSAAGTPAVSQNPPVRA